MPENEKMHQLYKNVEELLSQLKNVNTIPWKEAEVPDNFFENQVNYPGRCPETMESCNPDIGPCPDKRLASRPLSTDRYGNICYPQGVISDYRKKSKKKNKKQSTLSMLREVVVYAAQLATIINNSEGINCAQVNDMFENVEARELFCGNIIRNKDGSSKCIVENQKCKAKEEGNGESSSIDSDAEGGGGDTDGEGEGGFETASDSGIEGEESELDVEGA